MPRLIAVAVLLDALLLAPHWLLPGGAAGAWLAPEALLLVALLALVPATGGRVPLRWVVLVLVGLGVGLGLGEAATRLAFGRGLNLALDAPLLRSLYHLLVGNLGASGAVAAVLLALLVLGLASWWLAGALHGLQGMARRGSPAGLALVLLALGAALLAAELTVSRGVPGVRLVLVEPLQDQARRWGETRRARRDFASALAARPTAARALPGLAGGDVLLVFVESYGASALHAPPFASTLRPRLATMAEELEAAGLSVVTARLASPVRGGRSWLAHATALSGRWIDDPAHYRRLLASEAATLVDDFRASGHRTLAVMPAITRAWPEGETYGFDGIHAAADLDYAGPSLNWVTMPDQFTLHHFERRIRRPADAPLFAVIALISSHAPWTPILPLLDWEAVGDGSVFQRFADQTGPAGVLRQGPTRLRDHYARSLGYAVQASSRWAGHFLGDDDLLILLGDHPAAPLITGDAGDGVVVHVISGDPARLAPFRARGFVPGTLPAGRGVTGGLDELRGWLGVDFGAPGRDAPRPTPGAG